MNTENTEKLMTLTEINELKTTAQNHFELGKFNEAIKITLKIIDIAEKAQLYSIAREQGLFVAEIYKKIQDKNKISSILMEFNELKEMYNEFINSKQYQEAHELIKDFKTKFEIYELLSINEVKEFLHEEEEIWRKYRTSEYNIKTQLEPLQIQLNSYIQTNNLLLAEETLEKAKLLLKNLSDPKILKYWRNSEDKLQKIKVTNEVEESLKKVSELTDTYKFDTANKILDYLIKKVINHNLLNLQQKIDTKKRNVIDAEKKYNKLEKELTDLEKQVQIKVSENKFQKAIDLINQIIKISRFIGKTQFLDKYTRYVEEIEKKINFQQKSEVVKNTVKNLNYEGFQAIIEEDFLSALKKYKEIIDLLKSTYQ